MCFFFKDYIELPYPLVNYLVGETMLPRLSCRLGTYRCLGFIFAQWEAKDAKIVHARVVMVLQKLHILP